ncbi:MAG TPA: type II secretion system minor pseudopilin GspI [Nitrospirota bacterium]|nr:type II secretion system minor pseudopilin GspI [Nitrospirota bacterium]
MKSEYLRIDTARQPLNQTGFTLLEVMVAVAIMAMVLITLLGLKNRSMNDVMLAKHITVATMLAKRMMVENTAAEPDVSPEEEGPFPEPEYKDYTWKKTIVPTPIPQIMELHVAVLWKEGTRDEMVEIVNYE